MSAFSDARQVITDALADVAANVYGYPPEVVSPPAVVVVVQDPMAELTSIGTRLRFKTNYTLQIAVAPMDNLSALETLEDLVIEVLTALPTGVGVGPVSAPSVRTVGNTDMAIVEIPVQVMAAEGN